MRTPVVLCKSSFVLAIQKEGYMFRSQKPKEMYMSNDSSPRSASPAWCVKLQEDHHERKEVKKALPKLSKGVRRRKYQKIRCLVKEREKKDKRKGEKNT